MTKASFFKKACGVAAGAACLLALSAAPARAVPILVIDFDNSGADGGTVTAAGGGNYVGTNIIFDSIFLRTIDSVTGLTIQNFAGVQCGDDTSGSGTLAEACTLNFDTASGAFNVTALGGLYDIGADFTAFTADRGGQVVASGGTVVAGTISTFNFTDLSVGPLTLGAFTASGTDTKNPSLLRFFGITSSNFVFANSELTVGANGAVTEADLVNFPVPEPGSLGLLGLGMLAAGRAIRRRRQAKA